MSRRWPVAAAVLAMTTGLAIAAFAPLPADSAAVAAASTDRPTTRAYLPGLDQEPSASTRRESVIRSGYLEADTPLRVADMTVGTGQYIVSYTLEASLQSAGGMNAMVCGVVDADGRFRYLAQDGDPVFSGSGWQRLRFAASFTLPDITLGLRCSTVGTSLSIADFRDVEISATRIPDPA